METQVGKPGGKLPDKLYYKASEVCQLTDTQPYVLRFWESEFPQLASEKNRAGQRVYRRQDIELILRIKKLLYEEEYTIAGARKFLEGELAEGALPATGKPHGKRVESEPVEAPAPAERHAEHASLFGEARPETPASAAAAPESPSAKFESLYSETHVAFAALKAENEALAAERDRLRERQRRVLSGLEAALEH